MCPFVSLKVVDRPNKPLHLELIPKPCWYINVRTMFSKEHWDLIRKAVYVRANYQCDICSGKGNKWPVECHEVWKWDETTLIQRLVGFQALCPSCHGVKHVGYSKGSLSKTAYERLLRHQRVVNGWRKKKQALHFSTSATRQARRNKLAWTVDVSYAKKYLVKLLR